MRKFILVVPLLAGTLWPAQQASGQVAPKPFEKILGTWKRVPGPDEPSTMKVEPDGSGIKISFGCKQDGSCQDVIIGNYDGKPYKESANATSESSFRKTNDRTMVEDTYSNGKLSSKSTFQLSPDHRTLTRIIHNIDPPDLKDFTVVYDRIGGPVSKDDALIGFWKRDWNRGDAVIVKYTTKGDALIFTDPRGVEHDRNCDGNDHPDSNFGSDLLYSCRFLDNGTYESVSKRGGKVVSTLTHTISEDGRKMVWTFRNAEGKTTFEYNYEKVE
jgi:hypothetical protein